MRNLLLLTLTLLLIGCARGAPSAPTQAPGQAMRTPTPVRTLLAPQRRTVTASPAPTTPTARPTAAQPTKGIWTQAEMPAERVCLIADRRDIEDAYAEAMVRMGALIFRLEGTPEWMGDADYGREAKGVAREVDNLPELPCTLWGKSVLMDGASDLLAAFDWYDEQPEWATRALVNARASHTQGSLWWSGSRWWGTIIVPLG